MSEIRANTVSDAAGTGPVTLTGQSAAKAWVNFDGTGTIAARDSFNVASLTDNGTGDYTVNFTNAFADVNHAPHVTAQRNVAAGSLVAVLYGGTSPVQTASSIRVLNLTFTPAFEDAQVSSACSFGDLA